MRPKGLQASDRWPPSRFTLSIIAATSSSSCCACSSTLLRVVDGSAMSASRPNPMNTNCYTREEQYRATQHRTTQQQQQQQCQYSTWYLVVKPAVGKLRAQSLGLPETWSMRQGWACLSVVLNSQQGISKNVIGGKIQMKPIGALLVSPAPPKLHLVTLPSVSPLGLPSQLVGAIAGTTRQAMQQQQ